MMSYTDRYLLHTQEVGKSFFYYRFSIVVTLLEKGWIFNVFNIDSQL